MDATNFLVSAVLILAAAISSRAAPTKTTLDQKQSGGYNVQVHLKDFQIIAVLGDDSLGFGDYDYNYDYSDFTIKPPPLTNATASYANATQNFTKTTTTEKVMEESTTTKTSPSSTVKNEATTSTPMNANATEMHLDTKIGVNPVTNVAIVPSEDIGQVNTNENFGDVANYRRCSTGFTRDKWGRCRRVRRPPQISLGISRLATNLASKFRRAAEQTLKHSREAIHNAQLQN